jgi:hypothetical protein
MNSVRVGDFVVCWHRFCSVRGPVLEFADVQAAWLWTSQQGSEPAKITALRQLAADANPWPWTVSIFTDSELLEIITDKIRTGSWHVHFLEPIPTPGGGGVTPPPGPGPQPPGPKPPPPPKPKPANLHVHLLHFCDRSPLDGGTVKISGPTSTSKKTGKPGEADFDGIPPGTYQVEGSHPQHKPKTVNQDAPPAKTTNVDVLLEAKPPKIASVKAEYTVVLDKTGAVPGAHPLLEFNITDGPPDHLFDLPIQRGGAGSLTGGPGIANSWVQTDARDTRMTKDVFSSWSNGQHTLRLDGSGKGSFKVPLEWWRDQARQTLANFNEKNYSFRVVTFKTADHPCASSATGTVKLRNNLTNFRVVDLGYIAGGTKKSIRMEFFVREANTTDMYTMVQWKTGGREQWQGTPPVMSRPTVQDYGVIHQSNYPVDQLDRVGTNPRYWDGAFTIAGDGLSASATDAPSSSLDPGFSHSFTHIDFETRVHLNFEVPATVTVTRKDGSAPVFGVVVGVIAAPIPVTLKQDTWQTRVLQVRNPDGTVALTHPAAFAGP